MLQSRAVAQLVARSFGVGEVVGSNPAGPTLQQIMTSGRSAVGSAPGSGPGGRRFKSGRPEGNDLQRGRLGDESRGSPPLRLRRVCQRLSGGKSGRPESVSGTVITNV